MAKITLDQLSKSYGSTEVLHHINGDIDDGSLVVIVGPSGCGKSTLLRMIAGLETVTSGQITIGGGVVNDLEPAERDIAMVFQNYALYPHMSVRKNMAYSLKIRKIPQSEIDRRVEEAAEILELSPFLERKPRQLSGGQRQRVSIARALSRKGALLVLDEATSALDILSEQAMKQAIAQFRKARSVLLIAHRLSFVTHADQIHVFAAGRIVESGTHDDLLAQNGAYAKMWFTQQAQAQSDESVSMDP